MCLAAGLHLQLDFSAVFKAFDKGGGAGGAYSSYSCDPGEDGGPIRTLADAEPAGGGGRVGGRCRRLVRGWPHTHSARQSGY